MPACICTRTLSLRRLPGRGLQERNWRFGYEKHVVNNVAISCRDEETCLAIARAGLEYMHSTFEFVRNDKAMSLREAMTTIKDTSVATAAAIADGGVGHGAAGHREAWEGDCVALPLPTSCGCLVR